MTEPNGTETIAWYSASEMPASIPADLLPDAVIADKDGYVVLYVMVTTADGNPHNWRSVEAALKALDEPHQFTKRAVEIAKLLAARGPDP